MGEVCGPRLAALLGLAGFSWGMASAAGLMAPKKPPAVGMRSASHLEQRFQDLAQTRSSRTAARVSLRVGNVRGTLDTPVCEI